MTTAAPGWPAPLATGPVDATVEVPGSKSLTNRWLILGALSQRPLTLSGVLRSRDTDLMLTALRGLGTAVADSDDRVKLQSGPLHGPAVVDCGLAGTVMRFLPPVAALADGTIQFVGDPRASERPLAELCNALRTIGADIDGDALPLTVHGRGRVRGGQVSLDASASSQFVSGLLLAAPRFDEGLTVTHRGGPLPSRPHLEMTVDCLRVAGAVVDDSVPGTWRVEPGPLQVPDLQIEPDLSNAGPFLAAALVTGGQVSIPGWPNTTTQAGDALRALLTAMGAEVTLDGGRLIVRGTGQVLGLEADLSDVGELVPTIAAIAALADTPSRLTGVAHLRGHETDRLAALTTELRRLGGDVDELPDGLVIRPRALHGGLVQTYGDHRVATAAAILGLRVPGVEVVDVATTAKTMPGFVDLWERMLGAEGRA